MAGHSHVTVIKRAQPVIAKASPKVESQIKDEIKKEDPKQPEKAIAKHTKETKVPDKQEVQKVVPTPIVNPPQEEKEAPRPKEGEVKEIEPGKPKTDTTVAPLGTAE